MTEFPSARRYKAYLNSSWTEITNYVIEDITGQWGIQGNEPLDFLADPGSMRIVLNNMDQRFTPGHASALSGWKKGIPFLIEIDYDGDTYPMLGTIDDIDIPLHQDWFDKAFLTVTDWLEYSARDPIVNPGVQANQYGNQVIETTLGLVPIQPAATDLDGGVSLFQTAFDMVTSKTKAFSEFGKVAFSETGYVYLRKDKTHGETLVFESMHARHGLRDLDLLQLATSECGYLLKEDGGYLQKEDGGRLILDQADTLTLDNNMLDVEADYGKQLLNYFSAQANPRRVATSVEILFQLDAPISIAPGQVVTIKGNYADPNGGWPISGQDIVTPVATTDYLVNTESDGSGSDITADLALVDLGNGTEGFTHQVRNDNASNGWIIQYNLRGYGIRFYNPIEHVEKDQDSIDEYGTQTESIDQKYQSELVWGSIYTAKVIDRDKEPRTVLRAVTLLANQSPELMLAFLNFGPGKLIRIKFDKRGVDSYYYIQGIKNFRMTEGGMIVFTWIVKESLSLLLGFSMLAIEFAGGSATDGVNFGQLPYLLGLQQRSFSAWIWLDAAPVGTSDAVLGPFSDDKGVLISVTVDRELQYYSKRSSSLGVWKSDPASIPPGAWTHIVVTMDQVYATSDPLMYINAVSQSLTEAVTPGGTIKNEDGCLFVIGNLLTATGDYNRAFDGKIKDVRVYDRILSQADVTAIYNSGTPDETVVTDGLIFQAFTVRTSELGDYEDATLGESNKVLDNIFGVVGTPHGSPVGRSW